jgi:hypothetical protein
MTMSQSRQATERVRYATPHGFGSDIVPGKHLQQFSCRFAGNGAGALPGAVTCAAGAVTAIATGVVGANYSTSTARVIIVGDGTGAAASLTGVGGGGEVSGYTVTAGGAGYTAAVAYIVDGPVVVLVGDSISTEQPNGSNLGASMWYLMQSAIRAANPGRNITFFNRAVGGQTWTNMNSTASSNWPTWYSNHAKAWTDYVKECRPDLIIAAFGMNDRQNFVFAQLNASLTTMLGFDPEPDIVLVTPMVPSTLDADPDISSAASQIGRDATAGYERGYALANGHGLVDLNRRLRLVRDGLDVRHCALRLIGTTVTALPWTASSDAEGDFSLDMTFTTFTLAGNTLTVYLGATGTNTRTELLISDTGGYVQCLVRDYNPSTLASTTQQTVVSSLATPTGTVGIDVIVQDQFLTVLCNDIVVFAANIKRFSGAFAPYVAYTAAESPTIIYCAGRYAKYASRMGDLDLWGTSGGGDYAGNESNHPSSLALAAVIAPAILESDWAHSPLTVGTDSTGVTTYVGVGEPDPLARLHVTKKRIVNASRVSPASNANGFVVEDDTAPGISLLSGASGVARFAAGDIADPSAGVLSYDHGTDLWSISKELQLPTYTVAGLPAAASRPRAIAYCSNETGGAVLVFSDGANWRRVTDRVIAS